MKADKRVSGGKAKMHAALERSSSRASRGRRDAPFMSEGAGTQTSSGTQIVVTENERRNSRSKGHPWYHLLYHQPLTAAVVFVLVWFSNLQRFVCF